MKPASRRSLRDRINFLWNFEAAHYEYYSKAISRSVAQLIERHGIELFQIEETQGWAREVAKENTSIPVVVRLCGPWLTQRDLGHEGANASINRHRIEREGRGIFSAAALVGPSTAVFEQVSARYGDLRVPTAVIPNAVRPIPASLHWRVEECDRNLILFVGRFDRIKGADIVLRSFVRLAQQNPELRLMFVGPDHGLILDGGGFVHFDQFCAIEIPADIRGRITYAGPLARSEIDALRTKAFVTVVASRYESFGNVVLEAMSFGCPLVATEVGGIPEIVCSRRNGLLTPADDVGALSDAINEILSNYSLAAKLGRQAAEDCKLRFDPNRVSELTEAFYRSVVRSFGVPTMPQMAE
jgi:glycosyltransferase involved in cell wall biosynthesis